MTLLQVDRVTFGYGADTLFEDVSFTLGAGERLALVAPNGQGKSTLLRIIAGDQTPDEGRVLVPKSVRVGYLHQSHEPDRTGTVMDVLMKPFAEARAAREELTRAETQAGDGSDESLEALSRAQDHYQHIGAETTEREVASVASRVGLHEKDLERPVSEFSGGERGRLQLAAVLVSKPDLLLLDEPTNHLDLESIRWLEGFLKGFAGAIIVVSHDRAFLDASCPRTAELGFFKFRLYPMKYSEYVLAREQDIQRERREVEVQRAEIAKTEDFIRRNLAGQKTTQAKSRRRMLDKLDRLERPEDIWADARKLGLRFAPSRRSGDIVLEARGIGAERGERTLFSGINVLVRRLERVGLVGPNGSGKSTLLKILAGESEMKNTPLDRGEIKLGTQLEMGYFDQHLEVLDSRGSCVDAIRSVRPDMVVDAVRQYLARFRFYGEDPFRAVSSLSGGEKTRLALARLLMVPRNFLLLDEPTNHLDIPACEILEEALAGFDGTVILVSHDRYFLSRVCTRVLHLERGEATFYPGGYVDYEERRRALAQSASVRAEPPPLGAKLRGPKASEETRMSHEERRKKLRGHERRAQRVSELEGLVRDGEARLKALKDSLSAAPSSDWEKLVKLADEEQRLAQKIERWSDEWLKLSEENDASFEPFSSIRGGYPVLQVGVEPPMK